MSASENTGVAVLKMLIQGPGEVYTRSQVSPASVERWMPPAPSEATTIEGVGAAKAKVETAKAAGSITSPRSVQVSPPSAERRIRRSSSGKTPVTPQASTTSAESANSASRPSAPPRAVQVSPASAERISWSSTIATATAGERKLTAVASPASTDEKVRPPSSVRKSPLEAAPSPTDASAKLKRAIPSGDGSQERPPSRLIQASKLPSATPKSAL